ncbi:hypothetical protein CDD83_705 [Cordyceps sp. RAO-2017]|nr:hypothetical protein CDD83_705 [Cordyceps sp. RAO-2017]
MAVVVLLNPASSRRLFREALVLGPHGTWGSTLKSVDVARGATPRRIAAADLSRARLTTRGSMTPAARWDPAACPYRVPPS